MSNSAGKELKYMPSRKARRRQREIERNINNIMYFAQLIEKRNKKKLLAKHKDNLDIVFKEKLWVHLLLLLFIFPTFGLLNLSYHFGIKNKNRLIQELREEV